MATLTVEVRKLPAMSVIAAQVTSAQPEADAWSKLAAWAEPAGLLKDPAAHPLFGFNNPSPEPDKPMYGYEVWIRVDPGTAAVSGLERKGFPGGRYAVTTCRLHGDPHGSLPEVWQQLVKWTEEHGYRWRPTHELEHLLNPDAPERELVLELYLPIEED
jgi:DNA gyrase inhibitor GyrI